MLIEGADPFIKFALGENVKQSNWGDYQTVRFPQTRMGVEQVYYDHFHRAREYGEDWDRYEAKRKVIPTCIPEAHFRSSETQFSSKICDSGIGLARKFAAVVLYWLENLVRAGGGVFDWLENVAWGAGGVWTGSKIWHGLLVAS